MKPITFECYIVTNIDETKFYNRHKTMDDIENASLYGNERTARNVVRGLNTEHCRNTEPNYKYIKVKITMEET